MAVYRRSATLALSLINNNILEVMNLGPPVTQEINPSDLFISINTAVLWPRLNATNACSNVAPQWLTVIGIFSNLELLAYDADNTLGSLVLRNILLSQSTFTIACGGYTPKA